MVRKTLPKTSASLRACRCPSNPSSLICSSMRSQTNCDGRCTGNLCSGIARIFRSSGEYSKDGRRGAVNAERSCGCRFSVAQGKGEGRGGARFMVPLGSIRIPAREYSAFIIVSKRQTVNDMGDSNFRRYIFDIA